MKTATTLALIILFAIVGSAQSGRRNLPNRQAPEATDTSTTPAAPDDPESYSESPTNASRRIWARPKKQKQSHDAEKPKTEQAAVSDQKNVGGEEDVVRVNTSLVTIPVSVYDRNGLYIPNLRRSDFKIFEDGAEQEISYFGTSDKPFTVVLLIDVSPSTSYKIEEIQQAAMAFVNLLKPADRVMVVEFDQSVSVLTEFTDDRQKIQKAIRQTGFGGGTSLYDAVEYSLKKQLGKIDGRKAIVLFTDGVDTSSRGATFESTLGIAEESESLVFPIYYNTFLSSIGIGTGGVMSTPPTLGIPGGSQSTRQLSADYTRGRAYLTELATVTGGRVFRAESTPGGLSAAFEGIAEELSRQYSIGYFPTSEGEPGQRKQIKVRVDRPKLVVRSRDSYIVGSTGTSAATSKTN